MKREIHSVSAENLVISSDELRRRLSGASDPVTLSLAEKCRTELCAEIGKAAFCIAEVEVKITGSICDFGFDSIESKSLSRYLLCGNGVTVKSDTHTEVTSKAYFLAATLGHGADRYIRRCGAKSALLHYISDAVASAMVEALCEYARVEYEFIPHPSRSGFSPGYGDLPLKFGKSILGFLSAEKCLGITIESNSMLMIPTKSITAVIGTAVS